MGQLSLSAGTKTTDFRPPDLTQAQQSTGKSEDFLRGKSFAEKGDFEKALPLLERAYKNSPTNLAVLFWLGYTRENVRDTVGALRAYQAFLEQSPQPEVFFRVGLLQLIQGKSLDAASALQKGIEGKPAWAEAHLLCAYAYYSSGQFQNALPYAQKAVLLDTTSDFAPLLLGEVYFAVDSFAQAKAAYEEALRREPSSAIAQLGLGKSHLALLQPQAAPPHLQKASEKLPNEVQAHYYLGLAYKSLERTAEAKSTFQKALAIDPTHARSHFEITLLYVQEKKPT